MWFLLIVPVLVLAIIPFVGCLKTVLGWSKPSFIAAVDSNTGRSHLGLALAAAILLVIYYDGTGRLESFQIAGGERHSSQSATTDRLARKLLCGSKDGRLH